MNTVLWIVLIAVLAGGAFYFLQQRRVAAAAQLEDAGAEARRWTERLGGQVYALDPRDDPAARQALADASERYTAAGAQLGQARTAQQFRLAQQTAYEGLYYVSAARAALGLDPGPELPPIPGQSRAGKVTEDRSVAIDGREYEASPDPGDRTRHFYPGGIVAGRPVPQGWYSEPWWRPALVTGAWVGGSMVLSSLLFSGMAGMGGGWNDDGAYADGYQAGLDAGGADGSVADGGDYSGADGGGGRTRARRTGAAATSGGGSDWGGGVRGRHRLRGWRRDFGGF